MDIKKIIEILSEEKVELEESNRFENPNFSFSLSNYGRHVNLNININKQIEYQTTDHYDQISSLRRKYKTLENKEIQENIYELLREIYHAKSIEQKYDDEISKICEVFYVLLQTKVQQYIAEYDTYIKTQLANLETDIKNKYGV